MCNCRSGKSAGRRPSAGAEISYFRLASPHAIAPKGTFGQFQPNALPSRLTHHRPDRRGLSERARCGLSPLSARSDGGSDPVFAAAGWGAGLVSRATFGGMVASTIRHEATSPPNAARNIEHLGIKLTG